MALHLASCVMTAQKMPFATWFYENEVTSRAVAELSHTLKEVQGGNQE